jgi:hypothetical protein
MFFEKTKNIFHQICSRISTEIIGIIKFIKSEARKMRKLDNRQPDDEPVDPKAISHNHHRITDSREVFFLCNVVGAEIKLQW